MGVLFWYCDNLDWNPAIKPLEEFPHAEPFVCTNGVVAFVHLEPKDLDPAGPAGTKLVKNSNCLVRK